MLPSLPSTPHPCLTNLSYSHQHHLPQTQVLYGYVSTCTLYCSKLYTYTTTLYYSKLYIRAQLHIL